MDPRGEDRVRLEKVEPPQPAGPPGPSAPAQGSCFTSAWDGRQVAGVILVAIGLIFMAENTFGNVTLLHNWWALFLLVPGVLMLGRAWTAYQAAGHRFTRDVASALYSALFPTFIGLAFLLRLDWGRIWPVFLILAGVSALLSRMRN